MSSKQSSIDQLTKGDPQAKERFIRSFIEQAEQEALPTLDQALSEERPELLEDVIHRYRTTAKMLGLDELLFTLKSVDDAMRDPANTAQWKSAVQETKEALLSCIEVLR